MLSWGMKSFTSGQNLLIQVLLLSVDSSSAMSLIKEKGKVSDTTILQFLCKPTFVQITRTVKLWEVFWNR